MHLPCAHVSRVGVCRTACVPERDLILAFGAEDFGEPVHRYRQVGADGQRALVGRLRGGPVFLLEVCLPHGGICLIEPRIGANDLLALGYCLVPPLCINSKVCLP